jgi:hypothetical protein
MRDGQREKKAKMPQITYKIPRKSFPVKSRNYLPGKPSLLCMLHRPMVSESVKINEDLVDRKQARELIFCYTSDDAVKH